MATDVKQALADMVILRKDFQNDLLLNDPSAATKRLITLVTSVQVNPTNAIDIVKDAELLKKFNEEALIIKGIAEKINDDIVHYNTKDN